MNTVNKNLLMGGVAACAVALVSCGDKNDSAMASPQVDEPSATMESSTAAVEKTEMVSLNLSGLM